MVTKSVAFPALSEGLDGQMSGHFGHVAAFTLVTYDDDSKEIIEVKSLGNAAHEQGGCMAPVQVIYKAGAKAVILGGIGMRPLMHFNDLGIIPYRGIQGSVKDNFEAFVNDKLELMLKASCSGGNH